MGWCFFLSMTPNAKEARIIAHSVSGVLAVDNRLHTEKEEKVA